MPKWPTCFREWKSLKQRGAVYGKENGITVDQLAAQKLGRATPLPSLELSIQEPSTAVDNNVGYTALYGGYISWSGDTSPVARETYPRLAFDRLFSNRSHATESRSLLDLVMQDIKKLSEKIGKEDKHKLDEYLSSVRSLENRIAFSEKNSKSMDMKYVEAHRPPEGRPQSVEEHQSLMYDIMAMAFQTDRTRIASLMLGRAVSGLNYSFLGRASLQITILFLTMLEMKRRNINIKSSITITLENSANF